MVALPRTSRRIHDETFSQARSQARLTEGRLTIVAFGSSTTEGVGASSPSAAYPPVLQCELTRALPRLREIRVLNHGVGGENAADMLLRLERDAVAPDPDLVIWQTGTNDALRQDPVDLFVERTRTALARLAEVGIDRILMEPQWCPMLDATPHASAYLGAVRNLAAEMNVPVYPRFVLMRRWLERGVLTLDRMIAEDGLHLRDDCYALIAHTLADCILEWADVGPAGAGTTAASPASPDSL
jgi:acyl-CoA thioesterase I